MFRPQPTHCPTSSHAPLPTLIVLAMLVALTGIVTPSTVWAAPFTVTTTADSGPGSLRQAILDAEAALGADTISFDPALTASGPATISLTSVGGTFSPFVFNPTFNQTSSALVINSEITIAGPSGANGITIARDAAAGDMRVFQVNLGGMLTLQNLTVTGGRLPGAFATAPGGGILVADGSLTLDNVTISGNQGSYGNGVAVGVSGSPLRGGTLTATRSRFINNTPANANSFSSIGGGLYVGGPSLLAVATLNESLFRDNQAAYGGGLFSYGTTVLSGVEVSANTASVDTGGVGVANPVTSSLFIVNSTISGNSSSTGAGGLSASGTPVTVVNSTITGNRSNSAGNSGSDIPAGGVANSNDSGLSSITLHNTIVAGNLTGTGTPA